MKSELEIIKQFKTLCKEFENKKQSKEEKLACWTSIFILAWVLDSDELNALLKRMEKK